MLGPPERAGEGVPRRAHVLGRAAHVRDVRQCHESPRGRTRCGVVQVFIRHPGPLAPDRAGHLFPAPVRGRAWVDRRIPRSRCRLDGGRGSRAIRLRIGRGNTEGVDEKDVDRCDAADTCASRSAESTSPLTTGVAGRAGAIGPVTVSLRRRPAPPLGPTFHWIANVGDPLVEPCASPVSAPRAARRRWRDRCRSSSRRGRGCSRCRPVRQP